MRKQYWGIAYLLCIAACSNNGNSQPSPDASLVCEDAAAQSSGGEQGAGGRTGLGGQLGLDGAGTGGAWEGGEAGGSVVGVGPPETKPLGYGQATTGGGAVAAVDASTVAEIQAAIDAYAGSGDSHHGTGEIHSGDGRKS